MSESLTLSRLWRQKLLSLLMGVQTSTASRKSGRALLSHREFWCWSVAVSLQRGKRPGRSRALLPFPLLGRQSGRSLPTGRVQLGEASCPSSSWLPLVTGREPAEFSALPGLETGAGSQRHEQDLPPGDVPQSLPGFLVAHCGDPASWIYSDQMCDGINNCGDCSDELSPVTTCPPCGPGWWRCPSTVFRYCSCIPRSLCRDHVQHCFDWSDEYSCPGP
ncbi:PREDICTED: low-density lipoprotein receptor class A domain-containing protein 1 isoform X2 [Bison bison bison]|uniref:Low-density lipoprotein receptor class A domain-containing protein 1 isoform X2 n=1 Tax=Bison bison bison TaxID=43346 RepID=A0A6P3I189_BISBB|nr:PREDICTED: low-density lipoprotein receptor class A domain-containing protein 1 isoform X2 [Bison bison bison]